MKRHWSCENCGTLLGIKRGEILELKYKSAQYAVEGAGIKVTAVCRECQRLCYFDDKAEESAKED